MNIDSQVGFRIKNIRQTNGLTLEQFGKLFGASKGNVSLWEKGSSLPSNERIKKIAQVGNMSVEELLYGEKTISNSELELIKKLTKENEQLKDEIKDLKEIIEKIKSIVLSKERIKEFN